MICCSSCIFGWDKFFQRGLPGSRGKGVRVQCDVVGKKHFACLPYLVGDRGAAAKHCRGGCARVSDPRDVGFNLSASPWHPVKTVFLFLLSTSYPCPMQCTLTHFSCCTGHTTYSPEGGVHNIIHVVEVVKVASK